MDEKIIATTIPHSDFGDPGCCGRLNGVVRGEKADIYAMSEGCPYNSSFRVTGTLDRMESSLQFVTTKSSTLRMGPHCAGILEAIRFHVQYVREKRQSVPEVESVCAVKFISYGNGNINGRHGISDGASDACNSQRCCRDTN